MLAFVTYLYTIGCYEIGREYLPSAIAFLFRSRRYSFWAWLRSSTGSRRPGRSAARLSWLHRITTALIIWNMGLVFQWGTHLIPARGPISWRDAAYNQVAVVPVQAARTLEILSDGPEANDVAHRTAGR